MTGTSKGMECESCVCHPYTHRERERVRRTQTVDVESLFVFGLRCLLCHTRGGQKLELGMAPMDLEFSDRKFVKAWKKKFAERLEKALAPYCFGVDSDPELEGLWGEDLDIHTLSHQSVQLGIPAVQFEVPRRMRAALVTDTALFRDFVDAIATTYTQEIVPWYQKPTKLDKPKSRSPSLMDA